MKNLAEAEYTVALYMYMRLLGYPAERISILTTYNGQKHLIRDVINQRCAGNPFFNQPSKVRTHMTTASAYTVASNDCILFMHYVWLCLHPCWFILFVSKVTQKLLDLLGQK